MAAKGYVLGIRTRLVDQANTIRRNSWMTELEIEEPESDSVVEVIVS